MRLTLPKSLLKRLSGKTKLKLALLIFFFSLSIPTAVLIKQAYSQIKWEAFHQYQQLAEELSIRINNRLIDIINTEEARSFSEYNYFIVESEQNNNYLQRSTLSSFPMTSNIPGLIGYFQIGNDNHFSTPLLPKPGELDNANYNLPQTQIDQRHALQDSIYQILRDNKIALTNQSTAQAKRQELDLSDLNFYDSSSGAYSTSEDTSSSSPELIEEKIVEAERLTASAFDQLNSNNIKSSSPQKSKSSNKLGRVDELKFDQHYQQIAEQAIQAEPSAKLEKSLQPKRKQSNSRMERSILPETVQTPQLQAGNAMPAATIQVNIFESEIDPLEISLLDSGHFIIYRKVWRDQQRFIQGLLVDQTLFLQGIIGTLHTQTTLANMSDLITAYQGDVLSVSQGRQHTRYEVSTQELQGSLLYQTRLSDPFSDFELIYTITRLPAGPGAQVITWVAVTILIVLCIGTYLMYRLSLRQMSLAGQQQDFVSAVSHELKTPITSIRMYGEMLKEGWADENKKNTYYQFIYDESERLTRLINNVLQLARMTRHNLPLELKPISTCVLIDTIQSKISSQVERAGFKLLIDHEEGSLKSEINIDIDLFIQIIINLVDNAIKFSAKADNKSIELQIRKLSSGHIEFSIRDYGPGIAKNQIKKIFTLFYRSENELTRETVGTGIGLALVHQLSHAMHGQVDVINCEPGCKFILTFPIISTDR